MENPKLLILHDLSSHDYPGGAELWSDKILELSGRYGVDAKLMNLKNSQQEIIKEIDKCDKILLMNEWFFQDDLLDCVLAKPYIKMQLDYAYMPQRNGVGEVDKNHPRFLRELKLMANAQTVIFMNPKHKEKWEKDFAGFLDLSKALTINIFMGEFNEFYDYGKKRIKNSCLFLGRFAWEKGIDNMIEYAKNNPDEIVFFVGFGDPTYILKIIDIDNCIYLGQIPHQLTPKIYNKFEKFLVLPNWLDPGPTTQIEAELCGMEIIQNENSGISSHNWKNIDELKKQIMDSRELLFREIKNENLMDRKYI